LVCQGDTPSSAAPLFSPPGNPPGSNRRQELNPAGGGLEFVKMRKDTFKKFPLA